MGLCDYIACMSQPDTYLASVRDQYEDLPYPPRNPEDERRRLEAPVAGALPIANALCFGGKQRFTGKNVRILDAGGGTGDSTIFMAEQLRDSPAQLVHLDMSAASQAICRERAKIRGLTNIQFIHASLLDIPQLGLEPFDYIVCSGVLHHLKDPDAGLKALRGVMKPESGLFMMVYAPYGRMAVYMLQDLLRRMNGPAADHATQLANAQAVLKALPAQHWHRLREEVLPIGDLQMGPAGVYDLLLHSQDRAYAIDDLAAWVERNGLHIAGQPGAFGHTRRYRLETYLPADLIAANKLDQLPLPQQWALAELLNGQIKLHEVWLTPAENPVARWDDPEMVPTILDASGQADMQGWQQAIAANQGRQATFQAAGEPLQFDVTPAIAALMGLVDGQRPVGEIIPALAARLGLPPEKARQEWQRFYDLFGGIQYLTLRHKDVPVFRTYGHVRTGLL